MEERPTLVKIPEIGGARVIITETFRDMALALIPSTIRLQTPAEFALNTAATNPTAALRAVEQMAGRFRNPLQCSRSI